MYIYVHTLADQPAGSPAVPSAPDQNPASDELDASGMSVLPWTKSDQTLWMSPRIHHVFGADSLMLARHRSVLWLSGVKKLTGTNPMMDDGWLVV